MAPVVSQVREQAVSLDPAPDDTRPGLRPALWVPLLIAIVAVVLVVSARL
jgi:hypothetical protein